MITAIVPVKTKSERLKEKNLRYFIDCPMYEHKLRQLKDVMFDRIVVSSESKEVLKVAEKYGCHGHLRNPKYSTPDIPMSEVYSYIASEVPGNDIAWVNVNNPLVDTGHYVSVLETWKKYKTFYDCLLSVYDLKKFVLWKGKPINWTPSQHPKTQDLEGLTAMSFAINIRPREDVIKYGCFVGSKSYFYKMGAYVSTKVDYEEDLEFCKLLWNKKLS